MEAKSEADQRLAVKTVSLRIQKKKPGKQHLVETYKAKANQHEYYYDQFSKRATLLERRVKEHQEKSEKLQDSARDHEEKANGYLKKSRSSLKAAEDLHSLAAQYLSQSKTEIKAFAIADAESREAAVLSRGYELEAKDHFIWATDLRRRAERLLHLANLHRTYSAEAEHNAEKQKELAEQEEASSKTHLEQAQKFESKHLLSDIRAKEYFRKYEDYLVKSRVENNFARQSKIKASYEEALSKAFDQASLDMKSIAKTEEAESSSLKSKAESEGRAARALQTAAVHIIQN
jgi:hypothetical protein